MIHTSIFPVILKYSMPDGSLAAETVRLSGGTFTRVDDARELVSEVEVSEFTLGASPLGSSSD